MQAVEVSANQLAFSERVYEFSKLPRVRATMLQAIEDVCAKPAGTPFPTDKPRNQMSLVDRLAMLATVVDQWRCPAEPIGPSCADFLEADPQTRRYAMFQHRISKLNDADLPTLEMLLADAVELLAPTVENTVPQPRLDGSATQAWNACRVMEHGMKHAPAVIDGEGYSFTPDFTTVNWFGTQYKFKRGQQANAIGQLLCAYERGRFGLTDDVIRDKIESADDNFRLDSVFRDHPALGTMIQRIGARQYSLSTPTAAHVENTP